MKKFQFRMAPLLRLRQQQEDQKQRVVASLIGDLNTQQQQAVAIADNIKKEGHVLKQQFEQGHIDVEWISHYFRFVIHSQRAIQDRITHAGRIQKDLNIAREELAHAARQKKVLETLKDKQKERYDKELNRMENRELDELATTAFIRKSESSRQVI